MTLIVCLHHCDMREDIISDTAEVNSVEQSDISNAIIHYFQHRAWMALESLSYPEITWLLRWIRRPLDMLSVFLASLNPPSSSQIISGSTHIHSRHNASLVRLTLENQNFSIGIVNWYYWILIWITYFFIKLFVVSALCICINIMCSMTSTVQMFVSVK
jgi:hypothetical protein